MGVRPGPGTVFKGNVHICGVSGDMKVCIDPVTQKHYINQGESITFTPPLESR